jgi:hypothetical protein
MFLEYTECTVQSRHFFSIDYLLATHCLPSDLPLDRLQFVHPTETLCLPMPIWASNPICGV